MCREINNEYYSKKIGMLKDTSISYNYKVQLNFYYIIIIQKTLKARECIAEIDDLLEAIRAWKVNKNNFTCY